MGDYQEQLIRVREDVRVMPKKDTHPSPKFEGGTLTIRCSLVLYT